MTFEKNQQKIIYNIVTESTYKFDYTTAKCHVITNVKKLMKLLYEKMDSLEANEEIHI